jgi:hypothetical protein
MWIVVKTAWNAATSTVLDIGDDIDVTPDVDEYRADLNVQTVGATAMTTVPNARVVPAGGAWITATATSVDATNALSEGEAVLFVEYIQDGRSREFNSYRG